MGTDDAECINPKGQGAAAHPLSPWQGAPSPLYLHPAHPHLPMVLELWFGGLIAQKNAIIDLEKGQAAGRGTQLLVAHIVQLRVSGKGWYGAGHLSWHLPPSLPTGAASCPLHPAN